MKAIAGFVLASTLIWAHEIGTTRVSVLLDAQREYRIEVVTDAASLMEKLGANSLASFPDDVFRGRVKVMFDGVARQPRHHLLRQGRNTGNRGDRVERAHTRRCARVLVELWLDLRLIRANGSDRGFRGAIDRVARGRRPERPIRLAMPGTGPNRLTIATRYLLLGFTHIVPKGLDHMLFVLGIYLLSRRARSVLWQVSAFTVAHSITLGLGMYGLVAVPPGWSSR